MKPLLLILINITLFLPLFSSAQTDVPIENGVIEAGQGFVPCEGAGCGTCDFIVVANTGIKWLITISFLFFAILAVKAGIELVISQGNPSALSKAKGSFTNAFIGLAIILVAWILIDTLLRQLLDGGTGDVNGYGPWSQVTCTEQVEAETAVSGYFEGDEEFVPVVVAGVTMPAGNAAAAGAGLTDAVARERLTAAGIGIKSEAVLAGVRPHVITEAIRLKQACGCNLYVTDATGEGHGTDGTFTHINGFKLDFRSNDNPALLTYIRRNYAPAGTWRDGTPLFYNPAACATYALENDHVDVVYRSGC
jgi:Type IV secretion system pilin